MVHRDTIATLVDAGASVLGGLGKEMLVHRNETNRMREEKEMELELARARQEHAPEPEDTTGDETEPQPEPAPTTDPDEGLSEAFADLKAQEDCGVCRQLLEAIEHADRREQVAALAEYGRFKAATDAGASEEELREVLEESPTLTRLLEQEMGV